jgi:hypothetical protein
MGKGGGTFDGALCRHHVPIKLRNSALRDPRLDKFQAPADASEQIVEIVCEPAC